MPRLLSRIEFWNPILSWENYGGLFSSVFMTLQSSYTPPPSTTRSAHVCICYHKFIDFWTFIVEHRRLWQSFPHLILFTNHIKIPSTKMETNKFKIWHIKILPESNNISKLQWNQYVGNWDMTTKITATMHCNFAILYDYWRQTMLVPRG